ncbi:MAG TPA: glutamate--tRNA ligase [Dehalococcoidia bacterium]|nr:glutamate--tRNA ligase [Dehalococcoidia bacterium]
MSTVRTRYAPSPTGVPHVGNLRTALFSWLVARHAGGQFLVRLEDTDRTRFVPESVAAINESLDWLGLDRDEGPDVGGPYGPYVQSERLGGYRAAADRLIAQGDAYECWCSSQRLELVRAEQARLKQPPRYDRRCRDEAGRAQARKEAEAEGRGPVVRFRTPESGEVTFHDAIHGDMTFDVATLDDFVLLKSDGFPVYHLGYIVDDDAMKITHVLRGDEWIPSAPRHMLIYRALGIDPPVIAHVPRILGPDGQKLSKRHGATSVFEYRDQGYLPDALVNFLALIGWSLDDKTEIMSREELVRNFTLDRVVKNPGVFNIDKLTWMNGVYIREMPEDELTRLFAERLDADLPASVARPVDRALVRRIVPLVRERVKLLSEVVDYCDFFFVPELHYTADDLLAKAYAGRAPDAVEALRRTRAVVQAAEWSHAALEESMRALASDLGVKAGDLFSLARVAVTGKRVSPPLFETMEILGRDACLARLADAADKLG